MFGISQRPGPVVAVVALVLPMLASTGTAGTAAHNASQQAPNTSGSQAATQASASLSNRLSGALQANTLAGNGRVVALAQATAQPPLQAGFADPAFQKVWERTDKLVASGQTKRSWYWGPAPGVTVQEAYAEGQGGQRLVQYFDKSRMEINNPNGNKNDPFYVTNGLLTVELISGKMQVGTNTYVDRYSADIPLASDPDDANAPTYLSFLGVSNTPLGDRPAPSLMGQSVTATISRDGTVGDDPSKVTYPGVTVAYYDQQTKHNVPQAIWDFLNSTGPVYDSATGRTSDARLSDPWFYATGLPISDAYWAKVKVAGQMQDVLIQAFERRVVTYEPNGVPGFKVQMGNIGQHYYDWRYKGAGKPKNQGTATPTPGAGGTATPSAPQPSATPTTDVNSNCSNIPPSVNMTVQPNCGPPNTAFTFQGTGFNPGENVAWWVTLPDQEVYGVQQQATADNNGGVRQGVRVLTGAPAGIWAVTMQGISSKKQALGYFKVTSPPPTPTPLPAGTPAPCDTSASRNGQASPNHGRPGDTIFFSARGFTPGEAVSYWFTLPDGRVAGTTEPQENLVNPNGTLGPLPFTIQDYMAQYPGTWGLTFQGATSHNQAVIFFCVSP